MQRLSISPRQNWKAKVESLGMNFHTIDDAPYWDESACYRFESTQIDHLEFVTEQLHTMCLEAVEHVVTRNRYAQLGIPEMMIPLIEASWHRQQTSLYGRFDLAWSGIGEPKLLEYNADTPTALLEASVIQWYWLQECYAEADQFNSIHEQLIEHWRMLRPQLGNTIYFSCVRNHDEDWGTTQYLRDTAMQAGFDSHSIYIEDIGWDSERGCFVDLLNQPISSLFKLYPWEWLIRDEFGALLSPLSPLILEPAWKIVLSSKGLLPILWQLFPDHPNLLAASFADQPMHQHYVRKPLFSREGSNIELNHEHYFSSSAGPYGEEGYIYQSLSLLPNFDGHHPVIGSWMIGERAAGIGIREDTSLITSNMSRFIPHFF